MPDIHIHIHVDPEDFGPKLDTIIAAVGGITIAEGVIMADLSAITAAVAAETTVAQSAVTLLTQLHDLLIAAGTDPQALADLASMIEANTSALSDAVTANTPTV